jgi:hypothetical protein
MAGLHHIDKLIQRTNEADHTPNAYSIFIAKFIWHTEKHLKMQIHAINQKQSVHLK